MKKAVFLFLITVIFSITCAPVAYAADLPYIVIGSDVWLLEKVSGNKLFLLPESYYAKIDNLDENYYYVNFNGVSGKVDKKVVSSVGYHAEAEGTMQELRVDSKFAVFTEIKMKSSMESSSTDIPVPVDGSLIFVGQYPTSEMWYYVKYNENYGYIKSEFTNKPEITISAFVPQIKPQESESGETETKKENLNEDDNKLLKILIITGLSLVLIVVIIILLKPSKKGRNRYYYEE